MLKSFLQHSLSIWLLPLAWLAARYCIGWSSHFDSAKGSQWGILLHLLFILLAIVLAMFRCHLSARYDFIFLFKQAAKNAILYAVGATLALSVYYGIISDELTVKKQQDIAQIIAQTDTAEEIAVIKQNNAALETLSKEQIVQKAIEQTELFTNLKTLLSLAFFSLTIIGFVYALIAAWLFNQFLFQPK
jgi:hypothetical protein